MSAYYNDNDKQCVAWLKELTAQGALPKGDVDDRSIREIKGYELVGYDQCHFFAGIGGWAYALELALWNGPVWTGSCPCQPFSAAGKRKGTADERHLWPEFHRLIAECKPPTVFGEQVASKDGRKWLAGVFDDLEDAGYAVAGADLCAAGVAAPHIRQRLYWVADADGRSESDRDVQRSRQHRQQPQDGRAGGVGDTDDTRSQGRRINIGEHTDQRIAWSPSDTLQCTDGKARRIEPGSFPLAHGVPARVGRLRGYGNAIVPQVAAQFIGAYLDTQRSVA